MTNLEIDAMHRELADRLVRAAVDGDDIAFYDSLAEVVDAGIRAAVGVCALLARDLAAAMLLQPILDAHAAGDATADEKDDE